MHPQRNNTNDVLRPGCAETPVSGIPGDSMEQAQLATLHTRRYASNDQDTCVCIVCHTHHQTNAQLRKHGKQDKHRPYGCICGCTFTQLDALERHIACKNRITKFHCPFCKDTRTPKSFSRADHLPQHLKTFHRIPPCIIPNILDAHSTTDTSPEDSLLLQHNPVFPCPVNGCERVGELAYLREVDLNEHILWVHHTLANTSFNHRSYSQAVPCEFVQDIQGNGYPQRNADSNFTTGGDFLRNAVPQQNPGFLRRSDIDINFNLDFSLDLNYDA